MRMGNFEAKVVGFVYSATYTEKEQRALQSRKWQLIGNSQWCCGAAAYPLPALTDIGPAAAASKHTIAPINHTRPSPGSIQQTAPPRPR